MKRRENIVVGLDIGTTKTCCIVGEETEHGLDIVGLGTYPSKGLRRGMVINIDATVAAIKKAVEEAELMAGCEINSVYAGIAGSHIKSMNSHGIVAIKEQEVTAADILRVLDAAQAVNIPADRELIHIIPQEYIVDDQDGIREPRGMSGARLAARVHIVTGAVTSAQNVVKCCSQTGLSVLDLVLQPLASAEAVLSADEKELGVLILDIGGGTTDIAVFQQGSVQHSAVIPIGGDHITRDIAIGLGTPTTDAERIKQRHGIAQVSRVREDETFEAPAVGGHQARSVSRRMLAEIIEPRVEEIFKLVAQELARSGMGKHLPAGVVLTGGATVLDGMVEMAERVFGMPVRRGIPRDVRGLTDVVSSPAYATAVGLVKYGLQRSHMDVGKNQAHDRNLYDRVKTRMGEWMSTFF